MIKNTLRYSKYATLALLMVFAFPFSEAIAQSQQELRNKINNLDSQIEQNEDHLHDLSVQAATLQQYVNELNGEIADLQRQINSTQSDIKTTKKKIAEAEAELARQQEIMSESIRTLYKQGNVSTVELIAASEDFGDFINQQEYIERVKISVAEAADKVKALKAELEEENEKLTKLLAKQQGQKKIVEDKRKEKQDALTYTRGQEARYASYVNQLENQRAQAQKDLEKLLARLNRNFQSQGPVSAGQAIGRIGNTGNSYGAHLHFEVRDGNNFPVNPVANQSTRELKWGFQWPHADKNVYVSRWYQCSTFPTRSHGSCGDLWMHYGVDIAGNWGDIVYAAGDGEMQQIPNAGAAGNTVIIKHYNGLTSYYFHLSSFN